MSAKYEFVPGDTITIAPGRTLKRIRALATIAVAGVAPGNLGGYVESETNLAQVYGDAWVSGDARVSGDAQVYGDDLIFWASKVGSENGTLTVYNTKDNTLQVTRGCFVGGVDEFLEASERNHDDDTHLEYRLLIEIAHSRITRARAKLEADQ